MGKFIDLTGKKFEKLTVQRISGKDKYGNILWECKCECGSNKIVIVRSRELNYKSVKSCGCLHKENLQKLKIINTKYEKCTIENCNKEHYGLGYCYSHWKEYKKYGKIRNEEERKLARKRHKIKKIQYCDICNDTNEAYYNKKSGMILCSKHSAQYRCHGKFLERTRFDGNEIILNDTYAEIVLYNDNNDVIGKAIIDIDQVNKVKYYRWHISKEGHRGYAQTTIDSKKIMLHRLLLNAPDNKFVDHRNRRKLDCRLSNLRLCTKKENNRNTSVRKDSKSQIRGIYKGNSGKWITYIGVDNKKIHLGSYDDINIAINSRIEAEQKYFGEFAPSYND